MGNFGAYRAKSMESEDGSEGCKHRQDRSITRLIHLRDSRSGAASFSFVVYRGCVVDMPSNIAQQHLGRAYVIRPYLVPIRRCTLAHSISAIPSFQMAHAESHFLF